MSQSDLIGVLQSSLYPGAKPHSVMMVLSYCQAAGLDPMQKPVHIVPMWDSKTGEMRDVVMPGIGMYRVQASRSGQFAGVSEPEFGPDVTEKIGGLEITYPAWCRVVVKRLLPNGAIAEFAAIERWRENYAVRGGKEKSTAPNAMWSKRPYAQLAKCAEAQALRKAFPEIGAAPTADEMEGKPIDDAPEQTIYVQTPQARELPADTGHERVEESPAQQERSEAPSSAPTAQAVAGDSPLVGANEKAYLRKRCGPFFDEAVAKFGLDAALEGLTKAQFDAVKAWVMTL